MDASALRSFTFTFEPDSDGKPIQGERDIEAKPSVWKELAEQLPSGCAISKRLAEALSDLRTRRIAVPWDDRERLKMAASVVEHHHPRGALGPTWPRLTGEVPYPVHVELFRED